GSGSRGAAHRAVLPTHSSPSGNRTSGAVHHGIDAMSRSFRSIDGSSVSNSGSAALELGLLSPVLIALMLLIVFAGRAGE
ncbi:MAG: TadE family protein, partial [Actinomycetota bacterium]